MQMIKHTLFTLLLILSTLVCPAITKLTATTVLSASTFNASSTLHTEPTEKKVLFSCQRTKNFDVFLRGSTGKSAPALKNCVEKGHLANVKVVISDEKLFSDVNSSGTIDNSDNYEPVVKSYIGGYYPFGQKLPSTQYYAGDKPRYDFNGKETDQESGLQDYGMRMNDVRIAKFLSVDPLAPEYPELTPYQFASNTPIVAIDRDGEEAELYEYGLETQAYLHIMDEEELAEKRYKEGHAFLVAGAVVLVDVVVTKGWLGRTLGFYTLGEAVGNGEKADQAKKQGNTQAAAEYSKRSKEAYSSLALMYGAGTLVTILGKSSKLFFRGTSVDYPGSPSMIRSGIVPTSENPAVSTVYALESNNFGNGVVYIASETELSGLVKVEGNVLKDIDVEIGIETTAKDFANRAGLKITAEQSRTILKEMGINIPAWVPKDKMNQILKDLPKMTDKQIQEYYKKAKALATPSDTK